jgi:hypothetical protein
MSYYEAYAIGNNSVFLSWQAPTNTSPITGYIISYQNNTITLGYNQTSTIISNLSTGTSYSFSIVVLNQMGSCSSVTSSSILVKSGYSYVALTSPIRIYDTRANSGYQGQNHTMGPGSI